MKSEIFEVKRERFHLLDKNQYILQGNWPDKYELDARLDGNKIEGSIEKWENTSALERFADLDLLRGKKVTVTLIFPENLKDYSKLTITAVKGKEKIKWFSIAVKDLLKRQGKPNFFIEEEKVFFEDKSCQVRGWVVSDKPVHIRIYDDQGNRILCNIQNNCRADVAEMFKETEIDSKCGFFIELKNIQTSVLYLVFSTGTEKAIYPIEQRRMIILRNKAIKYIKKGKMYLQTHGAQALFGKVYGKMGQMRKPPIVYSKWIVKHLPDSHELDKQRKTKFSYEPKISIVVPLYKTPISYLREMVNSVKRQTYTNWELCLSDGSGSNSPIYEELVKMAQEDSRIVVISSEQSLRISENTNRAIQRATGEFVLFMDHDDVITDHALFSCVEALNENNKIEIIYSDEDKMSMDGNKFFQPHFKPDFNIDLLCTVNYICHLFVVKRTLIDQVGMLRGEFDGAQDYDFILRCVEATKYIKHIPKILYHWRSHENSTSENPESKLYAFDAGQRAVQAHYDRENIPATVIKGEYLGLYRTKYILAEKPLISIIIPNKDHIDDLERCIKSIVNKSTYNNYEFIIVENNSTETSTFEWYEKVEKEYDNFKVVYYDGKFNYSKINNFGEKYASGEYLLLLNNDTEIINDDCLEELLGYCTRSDVGIVGARLYYEDDTIQHAGVVIGFGGIAGHCFVQQPRGTTGYCHRIICAQDYSAVTAACMMVKKSVFEKVGGMTEELEVAFNDVDFCLKVRKEGYLVVYNPYAELYHYESKSRGLEDTPEKVARFHREIKIVESRWPDYFEFGDPYYNPNLTLESQDFSLKRL